LRIVYFILENFAIVILFGLAIPVLLVLKLLGSLFVSLHPVGSEEPGGYVTII
jgi:hypothetical protein